MRYLKNTLLVLLIVVAYAGLVLSILGAINYLANQISHNHKGVSSDV